jgi:hypothetical protein
MCVCVCAKRLTYNKYISLGARIQTRKDVLDFGKHGSGLYVPGYKCNAGQQRVGALL